MNASASFRWFAATAVVALVGAVMSLAAASGTESVLAGGQPETTVISEDLHVYPNPVVIPFGQGSGLFNVYGAIGSWPAGELIISRSGQPPEPPIIIVASDPSFSIHDVPIGLFETVTVSLGPVGGGDPLYVEIVTTDPQEDPPPLDCAAVPCAWGLEEVVFPEWVDVTLGVADVRGVTVVVTRDRDRRVAGRHVMELDDGTATIRLTGLQPGTAYSTEYLVQDHLGHVVTAAAGSFRSAR